MSSPSLRRSTALALFLTLVLAASGPLAGKQQRAGDSPRPTVSHSQAVHDSLWSSFWSFVTGLWNKAGCSLDPYGLCRPEPSDPVSDGDAGCSLDPYGHCHPEH
jgi:hypothetical protein